MKLTPRFIRSLLTPLVYLAALLLLLEDWLWEVGMRMLRRLSTWPPLHRLEAWIETLGPHAALALFVLPAMLLFPVKLLALWAIAHGHVLLGLLIIVLAKVGGAAAVARIFVLTRPVLLSMHWFARLLHAFMELKQRWLARLHASAPWRRIAALGHLWRRWRQRAPAPRSWSARWRRLRRRLRARRLARQR